MKTLLFTSFLIIGVAGSAPATPAGMKNIRAGQHYRVAVADGPMPDPTSKKCPGLMADGPMPDPTSKKCPS